MLWRNRVITQVVVLCAVAGGAPAATAPPRTTAVGFGIVAHGVRSNGDQASGGSIGRTWAHDGDTQRLWLSADRTSSCAMTLSSVGPPSGDAAIVWTVDATLVSHDADMATVDLDMTREVRDQAITLDAVHQRRRRLALLEGNDPIVLEYARPEATQGNCDGYVIEAGMHVQDPPDVADARLAYDLWLVQTDRAGRQRVQRVEAQAGQGRSTEFGFAPLWFAQDGTPDASGPLGIQVNGTLRGRLGTDGAVHLTIGAVRLVRDRYGSGSAEAGGKSTDIGIGETVEVQLPAVSGALSGQAVAIRVTPRRVS
jgi:hypothetical protein